MRNLINVLLVAVLVGFAGQVLGWIAVPAIAIIVSLGARELGFKAWQAGAGAALAWGVMLATYSGNAGFSGLLGSTAGVFQLPSALFLVVALLLPFALGWSSAAIATSLIGRYRK